MWAAAAARELAYQPPRVDAGGDRPPELGDAPPDWRGLLDLLEDRTDERYDDLWREWVVREDEAALLTPRQAARERYAAVLREAGRWELPPSIRGALRAWQFEAASSLLAEADALLDRRAELERAARDADLRLPARLEQVFESEAGFEAAHAEADAERAAIEILAGATATRPVQPDVIQQLGLGGPTPTPA